MTPRCACGQPAPNAATSEAPLDAAELVVYERLRHLGCAVCVDPSDPDDCADVAGAAVDALRKAGMLNMADRPSDPLAPGWYCRCDLAHAPDCAWCHTCEFPVCPPRQRAAHREWLARAKR